MSWVLPGIGLEGGTKAEQGKHQIHVNATTPRAAPDVGGAEELWTEPLDGWP